MTNITEEFMTFYENHIADKSLPYPFVQTQIEKLISNGYKLAVCTNKSERLSNLLLTSLDFKKYFQVIMGPESFPAIKPDPRALLSTISKMGGKAEDAIMIGDSEIDVETAKRAKIPVIAVDFGYSQMPIHQAMPDVVISSYKDLSSVITKLYEGKKYKVS